MITINLSLSQYRVVRSYSSSPSPSSSSGSVECSRECSSAVPVTARASRMSQSHSTVPAMPTAPTTKTTTTLLPDTHPIYGIVNLALLAVSIYLLWANLL